MVREVGEIAILLGGNDLHQIVVKESGYFNCTYGNFRHEDIRQTPNGSKIRDPKTGATMTMLRATPESIGLTLAHRTQILYHADISLILMLLDARPGQILVESGTGSGALSVALANAVRPNGRLHTFEYHELRFEAARKEFESYGISKFVSCYHRDVVKNGFAEELVVENESGAGGTSSDTDKAAEESDEVVGGERGVNGVFLDLPRPFDVVAHAFRVLKDNGRLVTFSPCIEQVQKSTAVMKEHGFYDIRVFECLSKPWASTGVSLKRSTGNTARHSQPKQSDDRHRVKRRCLNSDANNNILVDNDNTNVDTEDEEGVDQQLTASAGEGSAVVVQLEGPDSSDTGDMAVDTDDMAVDTGDMAVDTDDMAVDTGDMPIDTADGDGTGGERKNDDKLFEWFKGTKNVPLPIEVGRRRSVVVRHRQVPMRGHTGYLTVAILRRRRVSSSTRRRLGEDATGAADEEGGVALTE